MNKLKELMAECQNRALHCCVTYQRINDYSVEIYTGYKKTYENKFYSDGHVSAKKAIKKGLKYLNKL